MHVKFSMAAAFLGAATYCPAARLTAPAAQVFDAYVAGVEARLERQHSSRETYLATVSSRREGGTWIEPVHGGTWEVSGVLMHHWRAAGFVPGASADEMLALIRDPSHLSRYYAPEVVSSRALSGDAQTTSLIRFKKQKIVTVVLDAEFQGHSGLSGRDRGSSVSRSTHIWQVEDPGTPEEHRRPEGDDDGFLWRLNSYWSFLETGDGLWIECEAVSLTRDIPLGLGWLIRPIIESLPRESLQFTLNATKNALSAYATKETTHDQTN